MKQIEEGTIEKKIHWSLLMGGRIYSIRCRAGYFAQGRFEE